MKAQGLQFISLTLVTFNRLLKVAYHGLEFHFRVWKNIYSSALLNIKRLLHCFVLYGCITMQCLLYYVALIALMIF